MPEVNKLPQARAYSGVPIPANLKNPIHFIVRASTQQPRLYVGMLLILIFAEVLGLYGTIVSILMLTKSRIGLTDCRY